MRLVLFDCDGTLVDSQNAIVLGVTQACEKIGVDVPPRDQILSAVGLSVEDAIASYTAQLTSAKRAELVDAYQDIAAGIAAQEDRGEALYDGMQALVHHLADQQDTLLGIVTMKSRIGLHRVCKTHGFEDIFQTLKSADDGPGKPNPQLIMDAMAETGVTPAQTVMIGDTIYDIAMAVNAGVVPIGVSWGYNPVDELVKYGARHIVETTAELKTLLETLKT